MAVSGLGLERLVRFNRRQLDRYFEKYARYMPDAPLNRGCKYVIRCGGKSLFSDDTMDLKQQMLRLVAAAKRRKEYRP